MKLKYYLRGLGIGILLTTIILSLGNKKETLSDKEIMEKARELGMVMKEESVQDNLQQVLNNNKSLPETEGKEDSKDIQDNDTIKNNEDTKDTQDNELIENEEEIEDNNSDKDKEDLRENELTENEPTEGEPTEDEDTNDNGSLDESNNTQEEITFTITEGMSSIRVAELLEDKGLIEDAIDFNQFIKKNGKASVLRVGTYTLPKDAEYKEILDTIS